MLAVLVLSGGACVPLLWLAGQRTGIEWLTTSAFILFSALILWLLVAAISAAWRTVVARRRPFSELLPAEAWAAMFALPIAASATSLLSSLGLTALTLTMGLQPVVDPAWRPLAVTALVLAVLVALAVPVGAAFRTVMQKHERNASLFDVSASGPAFERTLARRWELLRKQGRRWLPGHRVQAPGSEDEPPGRAWPSRWPVGTAQDRVLRPRTVIGTLAAGLVLVTAVAAAPAVVPGLLSSRVVASCVVALPVLTAMTAAALDA